MKAKIYWVRDSSGMDFDIHADNYVCYPIGGEIDANTFIVEFVKQGKIVATFLKPICYIDRAILEFNVGTSSILCEHANEVPAECKCDSGCYCKTHTCKDK